MEQLGFFDDWPAKSLVTTFIEFAQLRADIKSEKLTEPVDILHRLVKIDEGYKTWRDNLPEDWYFTEHTLDHETEEVLGLRYHTYTDNWIASIWTNYRLGHLIVSEMLTHYLTSFSNKTTPLGPISNPKVRLEQSRLAMMHILAEIPASIPFQLGFSTEKDGPNAAAPYAQGGRSCVWPLYLVGGVETAPAVVCDWAINRLHFIGKTMGIQPALAIATILRTRQQIREIVARYPDQGGQYMAEWVEIGRFSVFAGKAEQLFEEGTHNWMNGTDFEMIKSGKVRINYL